MSADIPYGYCLCGCGQLTPLAKRNKRLKGWVQGQPLKYIHGHNNRKSCGQTIADNIKDAYTVEQNGCWVWERAISNNGYGMIWVDDKQLLAHRHLWELHKGSIPPGLSLHHKCANRKCVNPEHLELVSETQHKQRHPQAKKLTDEHVLEIKTLYKNTLVSQRQLSKTYGVSQRIIWQVVNQEPRQPMSRAGVDYSELQDMR